MPYVDFPQLQALTPAAFKLYVYCLYRAEQTGVYTWSLSLAQLGRESHLPAASPWRYPSQQHGQDGTLRRALAELVTHGWLTKTGRRGRRPNTYQLLKTPAERAPSTPPLKGG